jgi:hypothetical protein
MPDFYRTCRSSHNSHQSPNPRKMQETLAQRPSENINMEISKSNDSYWFIDDWFLHESIFKSYKNIEFRRLFGDTFNGILQLSFTS